MRKPARSHALKTLLAIALDWAMLAATLAIVLYLYNLGLLQRMLFWFPRFDHIGLIGVILVPIFLIFMLIWAAFCVVVTCGLLLFGLGLAVALVFCAGELLRNLFAEPWAARDPLDLFRGRLGTIWRVIRRRP